jgi:hypothetical protein
VAPAISGIDAWGNLINRSGVIGKTNTEGLSTSAGTNNQLSGFGYDVAGNMTSNPAIGAAYVYDAENRLTSLQAQAPPEVAQKEKERDATAQAAASAAKPQFPLDAFTEFSAVMVGSIMEPGEGTAEGHIYRSGKLMRMEGPEGHGYFITDLSTRETFGLSTAPCVHDSHPFIRASPFSALKPGSTVERTATGKETRPSKQM